MAFAKGWGGWNSVGGALDLTQYQREYNAFEVNSWMFEAQGVSGKSTNIPVWEKKWSEPDAKKVEANRSKAINSYISSAYNGLSSTAPGGRISDGGIKVKQVY